MKNKLKKILNECRERLKRNRESIKDSFSRAKEHALNKGRKQIAKASREKPLRKTK